MAISSLPSIDIRAVHYGKLEDTVFLLNAQGYTVITSQKKEEMYVLTSNKVNVIWSAKKKVEASTSLRRNIFKKLRLSYG